MKTVLIIVGMLEKQGEKKPAIYHKFRVGDEIKTQKEESLTITKIDDKGYWSEDLFICGFDEECIWDLVEQKPTWNEEDSNLIDATIGLLNLVIPIDAKSWGKSRLDCIKWLKSLKDRVSCESNYTTMWKPSDEQMKALEMAINEQKEEYGFTSLDSLYEQLKAIGGE